MTTPDRSFLDGFYRPDRELTDLLLTAGDAEEEENVVTFRDIPEMYRDEAYKRGAEALSLRLYEFVSSLAHLAPYHHPNTQSGEYELKLSDDKVLGMLERACGILQHRDVITRLWSDYLAWLTQQPGGKYVREEWTMHYDNTVITFSNIPPASHPTETRERAVIVHRFHRPSDRR